MQHEKTDRWKLAVFVAAIVVALFLAVTHQAPSSNENAPSDSSSNNASSHASTGGSSSSQAPKRSPEAIMASGDKGFYVEEDDPSVKDYANMLNALQAKFKDTSREGIGNVIVACQQSMDKKGIKDSLLNIGWQLDDAMPSSAKGSVGLPEVAATYITLRIGDR